MSTDAGSALPEYASVQDVRDLLGALGQRLPASVSVETMLTVARTTLDACLREVYGDRALDFSSSPAVVEMLRWAEAKLAAAEVLSAMLVTLPESLQSAPARLRKEAQVVLSQPLPGFSPSALPDPDGSGPRQSITPVDVGHTSAAVSLFDDPYAQPFDRGARYAPRGADFTWEA